MKVEVDKARRALEAGDAIVKGLWEELLYVRGVRNDAWYFGYIDSMERMKAYIL